MPVFPTLSGLASFGKYEETELDESLFVVPSSYSIKVCPSCPSSPWSSSSPIFIIAIDIFINRSLSSDARSALIRALRASECGNAEVNKKG